MKTATHLWAPYLQLKHKLYTCYQRYTRRAALAGQLYQGANLRSPISLVLKGNPPLRQILKMKWKSYSNTISIPELLPKRLLQPGSLTIKFTAEKFKNLINFLDTTLYFSNEGKLESTLFVKPQDICTLLHNNSFHPESCKKGIIYSQALRYRRLITDNEKLNQKLITLRNNLVRRGYNLCERKKN